MAATVSILNLLTGSSTPLLASGDALVFVDISDSTQSPGGSTVRATVAQYFAALPAPVNITSASATALAAGLNGATNPAFAVDASTALQVAGLKVKGAVTGGTVAISVTDSGADANLSIVPKGAGTVAIGLTGRVTITPVVTLAGLVTTTAGFTGAVPFAGIATFNAGATVAGGQTFTVTGATITGLTAASVATGTFPGVYTITGALTLAAALIGGASSDITINTNKFTVAASSGNTVIAGTLGVTGASILDGLLTVRTPASSDPLFSWLETGTDQWVAGIDVSDSHKFKINHGSSLGTSDQFQLTTGGALTLAAGLSATSVTASGIITGQAATAAFKGTGQTTGAQYIDFTNTSGRGIFGVESAAGGSILTGTTAYATVLTSIGTVLQVGANDALGLTLTRTGAGACSAVFTGAVTTASTLTVTTGGLNVNVGTSTLQSLNALSLSVTGGVANFTSNLGIKFGSLDTGIFSTGAGLLFMGDYAAGTKGITVNFLTGALTVTAGITATLGTFSDDIAVASGKKIILNGAGGNDYISDGGSQISFTIGGVLIGGWNANGFGMGLNSQITSAASTTSRAGVNIPHGAAPTAPQNGDMWTTTSGLFVRINGVTVGPLT